MNFDSNAEMPVLVEPGVKFFIKETLKQCRDFKNRLNNHIFNFVLVLLFAGFLGGILVYKYKGKLTPTEKRNKDVEKQQYILTKIKNYQDAKRTEGQELITGLPNWDNEYYNIKNNNVI
jgi:hypothetical protein